MISRDKVQTTHIMFNANELSDFSKMLSIIVENCSRDVINLETSNSSLHVCPIGAIISSFVFPLNVKRRLTGNISAPVVKHKNNCNFLDFKLISTIFTTLSSNTL